MFPKKLFVFLAFYLSILFLYEFIDLYLCSSCVHMLHIIYICDISSVNLSLSTHHPPRLPITLYPYPPPHTPPHRPIPLSIALYLSPSLSTPPHRSLPLPIALYPSPSHSTPPHRPPRLPVALYPSPPPSTPPRCYLPLPVALYPSPSPPRYTSRFLNWWSLYRIIN